MTNLPPITATHERDAYLRTLLRTLQKLELEVETAIIRKVCADFGVDLTTERTAP